jgi:hypothetical protein
MKNPSLFGMIIVFVVLAGVAVLLSAAWQGATADTETIKVTEKYIKPGSKDVSSSYRIVGESETFELEDSIVQGAFDSADRFARMKVGHCYKVKTVGVRVQVVSSFRSIFDPVEVPCG